MNEEKKEEEEVKADPNSKIEKTPTTTTITIPTGEEIWELKYLEEKILSVAINDKCFGLTLYNHISVSEFQNENLREIFRIMVQFFKKNGFFPSKEIELTYIGKRAKTEEQKQKLIALVEIVFNPEFVPEKEKNFIVEQADSWIKRRKIKKTLIESIELMTKNKFDEILSKIKNIVKFSSKLETGKDLVEDIEERYMELTNPKKTVGTIFPALNVYLEGGFHQKELYIIMAASGLGKSAFLINQAIWSMKQGLKVVYVTLELSERQIKYRMDKCAFGMTTKELNEQWPTLKEKYAEISKSNGKLKILEASAYTFTNSDLDKYLEQIKTMEDFVPDIILVDYLELMGAAGMSQQAKEYERQGFITGYLRNVGVERNVPIITATQANRKAYEIDDEEKGVVEEMAIGESLNKLKIADGFFIILQSKTEREQDKARFRIMKNRHGEVKRDIPFKAYYEKMKFEEGN